MFISFRFNCFKSVGFSIKEIRRKNMNRDTKKILKGVAIGTLGFAAIYVFAADPRDVTLVGFSGFTLIGTLLGGLLSWLSP